VVLAGLSLGVACLGWRVGARSATA
jgi:hypothetical protein